MPLALALLNVSSPDMNVTDTLARLSHDTGAVRVAVRAGLVWERVEGPVGAGWGWSATGR